ncbi:MAG: hypothetical protein E7019_02715 [Alphaproteobacteria bacterium]|nr:hypothetical protein [Alphaproteobacteria bacterium]
MQENKYIGDEKMNKLLEHYSCPTPLEIVKMRFIGAICSPNLELRPTDVISSFWPAGQSPRLQTKEEADLFFKFFMGLWDEVFAKIKNNKIKLEKLPFKNLEYYCQRRFAEVEQGFVEGFWGGQTDIKLPAYLAEIIDSLSDLAGVYASLEQKITKGSDKDEVINAINSADGMVEKAIAFLIENSVLPRIESLQRTVN